MKAMDKIAALKRSLALTAVIAMTGTASAKNVPGGVPGELSADRTSATVTVAAQCDPLTQGASGALSVYIFQPSGRLLNFGIGTGTVTCDNTATPQEVTVNAVSGLAFKPGPATLLIRLTTVDPLTSQPTFSESGSRVDLHK